MDEEGKMVTSLKSNSLSKYRTQHFFESYGEIRSIDDYKFYVKWAKQQNKNIYILGNGSNTLFVKKTIKSLVLKNNIPKEIKCISEHLNLFEISSSTPVIDVLNYCYENSLDSFYYLASVPAKIGGALAMNAGTGKEENKKIYDFVESVTYIDHHNSVKRIMREDMVLEHRNTLFTGCMDKFIVSAVFKFPSKDLGIINPIKERIQWARIHQANTAPNCGSVFTYCSGRIMGLLKGFRVGGAYYSEKYGNWINNNSNSALPIVTLIYVAKLLHLVTGKKCRIEQIRVK